VLQYLHIFFSSKKKNVVPFASTGAAAARLGTGDMTAHRRFSIPARSTYLAPLYSGTYQHDVLPYALWIYAISCLISRE
jgi:hypothetical protein